MRRSGPAETGTRRLDIQGLRAVAVLAVVAYHAGLPIPGGFIGVDVFFVISGFVITSMLQREWAAHGRIRFGRFYLRRFLRLTPALALVVSVTVLLSTLLLSPMGAQQSTAATAIGAMFLVANVVIARTTGDYFDAPAETNALLHTWSLSVEEQFYLVFPLLLATAWVLARRTRRPSVPLVGVAGVTVVSLTLAVATSRGLELPAAESLVGFYGPLTRVWEFAVGALVALSRLGRGARSPGVAGALGFVGAALLVASLFVISGDTPFPGMWTVLPVAGTALLIVAGAGGPNIVSHALRSSPMVTVGDWSYSIYLWHWPFVVFAGALWPHRPLAVLAAAVLSLGPAVASYRWVEQPIRQRQGRSGVRLARLVALTVTPPVALGALLGFSVGHGFWSPTVRAHQAAVLEQHRGCHGYTPLDEAEAAACTWNRAASGAPIYLVGDSHARHLSEAVIAAGDALGRPVVVSTASSCPILDIHLRDLLAADSQNESCRSYAQGTFSYLAAADPGLVVLSASDLYWHLSTYAVGLSPGTMTTDKGAKMDVAPLAIADTVRTLHREGHEVLLVQDTPRWAGEDLWTPADCTVLSLVAHRGACERQMPVERVELRQGGVRRVLSTVAAQTGAPLLDPWVQLCPQGVCSTHSEGLTRYRDTNHLSVPQSATLSGEFRAAIAALD